MKKIIIALCVILLIGTGFLATKTLTAGATEGTEQNGTLLTVSGNGVVTIEPDTAHINIGVLTDNKDLKAAQSENSATMDKIIASLKSKGIKEEDIQTVNFNIYPRRDHNSASNDIVSFEVRNDLEVRIDDISKVGEVLDAAITAGANTTGSIRFSSSKSEEAYNDALKQAYESANVKAEVLVSASGKKIDMVSSITEGSNYTAPYDYTKGAVMFEQAASSIPIETGQLTVSATVTVQYLLK